MPNRSHSPLSHLDSTQNLRGKSAGLRILGIDPGYDRLGVAIIAKNSHEKDTVIFSECFQTSVKDNIYTRLHQIGAETRRVIQKFQPRVLAIENIFIAKNQKTAMRVSEARGIILYEATLHNIPVFEYTPMQIKSAITSDGSSDKTRVIKMVKLLVRLSGPKKHDDEYDAIAVALTHSARTNFGSNA